MVKKLAVGMLAVISLTAIFCSCLDQESQQVTSETETVETTAEPTATPIPTITPTPIPVKEMQISEGMSLSEGQNAYITFYCSCTYCCGPNAQGICADGTPVSSSWIDHSVAADSSIPFGTQFVIPELSGDIIYTVHDRGSAVHTGHFDIYSESHQEALNSPCGYYTVYFIQ